MASPSSDRPCHQAMPKRLHVISDVATRIEYDDRYFDVVLQHEAIDVRDQAGATATIRQKDQHVAYKARLLGGFVLDETKRGDIVYDPFFFFDWDEEYSIPEIQFKKPPQRLSRQYQKGQYIELGLEQASLYCVHYRDGVEAQVRRRNATGFEFSFSTGFYGSFWQDEDGSYTLKFKGDRLAPGEDDLHSQSKFVVSRSKYTGMLLLFLQDDATVYIA